ncbi:integrase [Rhodovulum sulfidophilum]|uniref:Site-specific integrase n=1 Tax=Rhodovulum visakhapatnamense TaxID=364297 RepID=A0ABS1RHT3_9RHOB|nr:site-specific integrase [Rhodovulum visakhapatnamense]MBL3568860.1 site-specific integrase [Rhodovulum visakhapatnamense]MBL3579232.1 site-specific integrase [Rhodovulum visakhapatnamense]OLS44477.1 integrase [Rhodovulum sulfidophilum]
MKLKAATVEALQATDKRQEIPDDLCTGLYLVVQPTGKKSWQVRYRHGGVHRRMTLASFPTLTLAAARVRAREVMAAASEGRDPAEEVKAAKAPKPEDDRDKIKTLIGQYHKRHLKGLKSGDVVRRELDRFVVAAWGERDIHRITKRDVIDLLDGIADSGRVVTANRVRAYLNKFLNWAVERDILPLSPATGVKPVAKEASRDRVLTDDEIRWFWAACEAEGFPWGPLGKVLLLTGQRLNEAAQITEGEIRGDLWHLTAERTKNGRAHDVPLTETVRAVLAGVERIEGKAGLIFTTTGKTPVSGFFKARAHLADTMAAIAEKERGEPVEIPRWTFHDLRRTAATGMARLGIPVRVTEAVLNHVSGTGGGIVAVYQRHDYADEKRQALEAWARFVLSLVEGKAENVVRLQHA